MSKTVAKQKNKNKNMAIKYKSAEKNDLHVTEEQQIDHLRDAYNTVVYKSKSFAATALTSLEARAKMWGLDAVPATQARVLELGCSMGGNIIGQAAYFPNAHFVGVDLAKRQIDVGNEVISRMGMTNIRLEEKNIMDIDASFGTFDYIIVHGIWSWVPDIVKEKIFEICRTNLSKRGIAYISYNTLPGWNRLLQLRHIMYFANRNNEQLPLEVRTDIGIKAAGRVGDLIKTTDSMKEVLSWKVKNIENMMGQAPYYIAHEYLEPINDPVYVNEFIDRAKAHGLAHVGDTEFNQSCTSWLRQDIREIIEELAKGDNTAKEYYLDHYYDTQFRRSLLCHQEEEHKIRRQEDIVVTTMNGLNYLYTNANTELQDAPNNVVEQALVNLCRLQEPFTIQELTQEAERVNEGPLSDQYDPYRLLIRFIFAGLVSPLTETLQRNTFVEGVSTVPPMLTKYVDVLALQGGEEFMNVANVYNETITGMNLAHVFIMRQLETPKTLEELYAAGRKGLVCHKTLEDGTQIRVEPDDTIDKTLKDLGRLGFLRN